MTRPSNGIGTRRGAFWLMALASLTAVGCASSDDRTEIEKQEGYFVTEDEAIPRGGVAGYVDEGSDSQKAGKVPESVPVAKAVPTTTLYFTEGSSQLTDADIDMLDQFVTANQGNTSSKMIVEGYTDGKGSSTFNEGLSSERARSVHDYLVGKGVSEDRLQVKAMGERFAKQDIKEPVPEDRKVIIKDASQGAEVSQTATQPEGEPKEETAG